MPGNRVSPGIAPKMFETRIWEWTRPTQYELMLQNVGKINWYGNIHLGEYALPRYFMVWDDADSFEAYHYVSFLNSDYRGEIYFLNKDANKAEFKYFSPDKIVARVDVLEPDILVINQNYDKYWRSSPSKPISIKGLLAVKLEKKGTYQVTLTYHPLTFYLGLCVSMAALIFIIYSLCFSRHE